jgi:hypothetical protein
MNTWHVVIDAELGCSHRARRRPRGFLPVLFVDWHSAFCVLDSTTGPLLVSRPQRPLLVAGRDLCTLVQRAGLASIALLAVLTTGAAGLALSWSGGFLPCFA